MTGDASTLPRRKVEPPSTSAAVWEVAVIAGPDAGRSILVDGSSSCLIGQGPACALRLTDPQVSRRHCSVDATARGLRVNDLGSMNGTLLGTIEVTDVVLAGPSVIRIGNTSLRVEPRSESVAVPLPNVMRFGRVVGASAEMRRIYPLCERLAKSDVPLVIEGETGTGKEMLAEALHETSPRARGPFIVFDCTAVPPTLVESALFGHERGAFTGAVAMRKGVFEQAHGGTLLIDEIGDLDIALQAKLLRALERSEVQRVGGEKFIKVDVRVLAATRRDLDREVAARRFRDDLFFRLAVARIELPPLRKRRGDIAVLAVHFWKQLGGDDEPLPQDLLGWFETYAWPGNVRELRNVVARRLALGELASFDDRRARSAEGSQPERDEDFIESVLALDLPLAPTRQRVVEELESRYVERVLARHGGNVEQAAAASGIARRYFYKLRARFGK